MSLFKAKEWWTSGAIFIEENNDLFHSGCMKLSQIGVEGGGDNIIIGNPNGLLQIFRPFDTYQPTHIVLECQLNSPILQVDIGKFVFGMDVEYIGILHPSSFIVYSIITNEGQAEFGNQSVLLEQYRHDFQSSAVNMTVGGFGGVKDKDFVCIQCMDGTLRFFEQDVATFTCQLPDFLLPGPIAYSHCTDSFIVFTSSWCIESYCYHNLSQLSEKYKNNTGNGKKTSSDWSYNIGETIRTIHKVQTSTHSCSLVMVSTSAMYCLSDNGTLTFMKHFDFDVVCSHAYLIGWYYDSNSRLMTMIVSETSTLLIYENVTLLWSCQLTFQPLVISRGFFTFLPGSIVAVTEAGELKCLYLGTDPDLFTAPPIVESNVDYDKIQEELDQIQHVINNHNNVSEITLMNKAAEREVPFIVTVSKNFEPHNHPHSLQFDENQEYDMQERLLKCVVSVKIRPLNKDDIDIIKVAFVVHPPFKCSVSNRMFYNVPEELDIDTDVYVENSSAIFRNDLSVMIVYVNIVGNVHVLKKNINLPLSLFVKPACPMKDAKYKVTLNIDKSQIELLDLFKDFDTALFVKVGSSNTVIAFESLNFSNETVTIISAKSTSRYRIQSDGLCLLNVIVSEIMDRFRKYFKRKSMSPIGDNNNNAFEISVHGGITTDIIQGLLINLEKHWKLRQRLYEAEKSLDVLSLQFILIQKRLMIKYREKPPTTCDGVHYLLLDTYQRLDETTKDIVDLKKRVVFCGQELCGSINLVSTLLRLLSRGNEEINLVLWALSPEVLEHQQQNWEETAANNVTTLLKEKFSKNEKERDKIVPFNDTECIKQFDGHKFMKYVQLLLERVVGKYMKTEDGHPDNLSLHRTSSSESQQLDTVHEEKNAENVLQVPQGSLLGFHKKLSQQEE